MPFVQLLLLFTFIPQVQTNDLVEKYRQAAVERWEEDIKKLEALDRTESDPDGAILFIGSSSIRLWDTMAEDMAPWKTIRRGYGGAKFTDLAVFVERLVAPHECSAVAIFVANDISGSDDDRTPEEVLELFQYVVAKVQELKPNRAIFFIAITPTSSRWGVWDQIEKANKLISDYCEANAGLHFVPTAADYLNEEGIPNDELFRNDKLHLNRDGYVQWGSLIKKSVANVLK